MSLKTEYTVLLTLKSGNEKTGPIPVSLSSDKTCPPSCPFMAQGCYARGWPLVKHWTDVSQGKRGTGWVEFCRRVRTEIPAGSLWRHNQAGDLPGTGEAIDTHAVRELAYANEGKRGFTYTHKTHGKKNTEAIALANRLGFTVNLSANGLAHADRLASLGCGPVVTVLPAEQKTNTSTPEGRKVVICPAITKDGVTCASCGLCQRVNRSVIVGFPAHGNGLRKASNVALNS
jgi:hypothetical protein